MSLHDSHPLLLIAVERLLDHAATAAAAEQRHFSGPEERPLQPGS